MIFLYCLITLVASIIGTACGVGSGIIVKPMLDILNLHNASTVSLYSAFSVLTMSTVSISKTILNKTPLKFNIIIPIALGSTVGGILANMFIGKIDTNFLKSFQALGLATIITIILLLTINLHKIKRYKINNNLFIIIIGLTLGFISVMLGIGGGPLNIIVYSILFSFEMKEATIYSLATIFFSQAAKLFETYISNGFQPYDLSLIPYICLFSIIGGLIGARITTKANDEQLEKIYLFSLIVIIALAIYNFVMSI